MSDPSTSGTDLPPTGQAPPPPPPPGYGPPPTRQLRRRPDEGPIAGVCAGLAEYFGIDVVLVRIAAVVLALSGPGVVAYVLAWIFVPEADASSPRSLHRHGGRDHGAQVFGIILLGVAVTALWGSWWSPARRWFFPFVLIALGLWLLLRRTDEEANGPEAEPGPPPSPLSPTPDATAPLTPDPTTTTEPGPSPTPPWAPWGWQARHHAGRPPRPAWWAPTPEQLAEHRAARRRRRRLGGGVMGVLLLWGGIAVVTGVSVQTALAVAVAIVGSGLVLGAFIGGGKALIVPAILLGAALLVTSLSPVSFNGPIGQRTWTPRTLGELDDHYEMSIGEGRLDLTELPLEPEQRVDVRASVGVGHLVIWVPEDVALRVDASASTGEVSILGRQDSGVGVSTTRSVPGPEGAPTIVLDLEVGAGRIEIVALPTSWTTASSATTAAPLG